MERFAQQLIFGGQTTVANYLLANYASIGMDERELVVYLQFKRFFDRGVANPSMTAIADAMSFDQQTVYQIIHGMIQKKLMTISTVKDAQGKDFDRYDFSLLYDKLAELSQHEQVPDLPNSTPTTPNTAQPATASARGRVFASIEKEFGRQLSPIEYETISQWLDTDGYQTEIIELALREAVLNQVYNLKYIDRILLNWAKRNIRTKADVEKEIQRYEKGKGNYQKQPPADDGPDIPIFKIK